MNGFIVDLSSKAASGVVDELRSAEHIAFLLAEANGTHELRVHDRVLLEDEHIDARGWHVRLTDVGCQHVLHAATSSAGWLVEAHSHGRLGDPARFSKTDRTGLAAWVPHVGWRLPGRGYAALVLGHDTIDGLVWTHNGAAPVAPTEVRLRGDAVWETTGLSLLDWDEV